MARKQMKRALEDGALVLDPTNEALEVAGRRGVRAARLRKAKFLIVNNCWRQDLSVTSVAQELEAAINSNTAMMLFFNANEPVGKIKAPEFVALAKKHNIPTFNDAAADVPPAGARTRATAVLRGGRYDSAGLRERGVVPRRTDTRGRLWWLGR